MLPCFEKPNEFQAIVQDQLFKLAFEKDLPLVFLLPSREYPQGEWLRVSDAIFVQPEIEKEYPSVIGYLKRSGRKLVKLPDIVFNTISKRYSKGIRVVTPEVVFETVRRAGVGTVDFAPNYELLRFALSDSMITQKNKVDSLVFFCVFDMNARVGRPLFHPLLV